MISPYKLYLVILLDDICTLSAYAFFPCLIANLFSSSNVWLYIAFICLFLVTVIPDKEDMYVILAAHHLTPENIEAMKSLGVDSLQQFIDTVIESSNKAKK